MPSFQVSEESLLSEPVRTLLQALHSDDFWPAIHAAEALTHAGHQREVLACLTGRLQREVDPQRRCGLARELVRAGDSSHLVHIIAVLACANPNGHVHACESLFKIRETGDLLLLRSAMQEKSAPLKSMMAAAALAQQGDVDALELLRHEIRRAVSELTSVVAWILGILGNEEDIPLLRLKLEQTPPASARAPIEHALALLGDSECRQALLKNLDHPETTVRAEAAVFAGEAGLSPARPKLKKLLTDKQLDVRVRAAHGLLLLHQR